MFERLVTILGGQWGKISLEKKYETFEKAIYRCQQRNDESNDSYLARADVLWTELLTSKVSSAGTPGICNSQRIAAVSRGQKACYFGVGSHHQGSARNIQSERCSENAWIRVFP